MTTEPEDATRRLEQLRPELDRWTPEALSEADTRAKLIDTLLIHVLGWQEEAIRREERTLDGKYSDYHLQSGSNRFILEAKKSGIYFEVPTRPGYSVIRRTSLQSRSPDLYKALDQVVGYCRSEGVPVGAVSNGSQYAVTSAFVPSDSQGYDTIVFPSIESIDNSFHVFWDLLAPDSSVEARLAPLLLAPSDIRSSPQYSRRLLDHVALRDEQINRNPLDSLLAPILERYFNDIVGPGREALLREAYIETDRQASYGRQIDQLLTDEAPRMGPAVEQVETGRGSAPAFQAGVIEAAAQKGAVVHLLVGGVGAGKTTFIERYFTVIASQQVRDSIFPIHLDLRASPQRLEQLDHWVDESVIEKIRSESLFADNWSAIQKIYEPDIARLRNGVLAPFYETDRQEFDRRVATELQELMSRTFDHTRLVIRYLGMEFGRKVCVIFDNVDQLSQEVQHHVLRLAYQRADAWSCFGILSMREETFWRYRSAPPLDAYHQHVYHVSAPRMGNVLARRLELAREREAGKVIDVPTFAGVEWQNVRLGDFLDIIVQAFLDVRQEQIVLLELLSNGDIRIGLELFRTFLLSGHTNTDEYLKTYVTSGHYYVPVHHLLRGIAFADRRYYDSTKSRISNLFSIEDDGFYSHFQKIRILRLLQGLRDIDSIPGRGFVRVEEVFGQFRALVSDEAGLRRVLDPLLASRLIESANGWRSAGGSADSVRMTAAGHYYLETLLFQFAYLDLCAVDTPILDTERYDEILGADRGSGRLREDIPSRLDRVQHFLDYLLSAERQEEGFVEESGIGANVAAPIVAPIIEQFHATSSGIRERASRSRRQ